MICNALLMYSLSFLNSDSPLTNLSTLFISILITPARVLQWVVAAEVKYRLVWVSFMNTFMLMEPSGSTTAHMPITLLPTLSRPWLTPPTHSLAITSVSVITFHRVIHLMSSSMAFKWSVNSRECIFIRSMWVSSTYWLHHWGRCGAVARAFCSNDSIIHIAYNGQHRGSHGSIVDLEIVLYIEQEISTVKTKAEQMDDVIQHQWGFSPSGCYPHPVLPGSPSALCQLALL